MSYVIAAPEMMTAAATDLAGIGSTLTEEHTAAAALTVGLVPAAADEVSAGVAHLFSRYAEDFQGLAGRAAVASLPSAGTVRPVSVMPAPAGPACPGPHGYARIPPC